MMQSLENWEELWKKNNRKVTMMNECLSKMFNRHVDEIIRIKNARNRMVSGLEII